MHAPVTERAVPTDHTGVIDILQCHGDWLLLDRCWLELGGRLCLATAQRGRRES
jgi:hypothetical protein